ncbi:winged helix-turn-helix DNA-binding domain-containing protein [Synechococcus sp. PROS-9-1]|nr:winged helix-turn-helix DNA-binding domain-containing protein [Synechococcus sp. PROS-9-1]
MSHEAARSLTSSTTLVSARALQRAQQAMRCLPFRRAFYDELEHEALSSTQLSSQKNWMAISRKPLSRSSTEDDLIWLIQVGVLRREVDGQGLTERVRLTPMGRDLLDGWQGEIPTADALQIVHHWLRRHRPRL